MTGECHYRLMDAGRGGGGGRGGSKHCWFNYDISFGAVFIFTLRYFIGLLLLLG